MEHEPDFEAGARDWRRRSNCGWPGRVIWRRDTCRQHGLRRIGRIWHHRDRDKVQVTLGKALESRGRSGSSPAARSATGSATLRAGCSSKRRRTIRRAPRSCSIRLSGPTGSRSISSNPGGRFRLRSSKCGAMISNWESSQDRDIESISKDQDRHSEQRTRSVRIAKNLSILRMLEMLRRTLRVRCSA